jgi:hypothetical protein
MKYIIHYIFNGVIRIGGTPSDTNFKVLLKAFDRYVWDKIKNRAKETEP